MNKSEVSHLSPISEAEENDEFDSESEKSAERIDDRHKSAPTSANETFILSDTFSEIDYDDGMTPSPTLIASGDDKVDMNRLQEELDDLSADLKSLVARAAEPTEPEKQNRSSGIMSLQLAEKKSELTKQEDLGRWGLQSPLLLGLRHFWNSAKNKVGLGSTEDIKGLKTLFAEPSNPASPALNGFKRLWSKQAEEGLASPDLKGVNSFWNKFYASPRFDGMENLFGSGNGTGNRIPGRSRRLTELKQRPGRERRVTEVAERQIRAITAEIKQQNNPEDIQPNAEPQPLRRSARIAAKKQKETADK